MLVGSVSFASPFVIFEGAVLGAIVVIAVVSAKRVAAVAAPAV